jgi:hypothetical protein
MIHQLGINEAKLIVGSVVILRILVDELFESMSNYDDDDCETERKIFEHLLIIESRANALEVMINHDFTLPPVNVD